MARKPNTNKKCFRPCHPGTYCDCLGKQIPNRKFDKEIILSAIFTHGEVDPGILLEFLCQDYKRDDVIEAFQQLIERDEIMLNSDGMLVEVK